jgi:putative oxidoreductase
MLARAVTDGCVSTVIGFPAPSLFLVGAIVLEIGGGLLLLSGFKARIGALMLIVFLIPATLIFHVASLGDPALVQTEMIQIFKNLAILGALVKFFADGAGAFALDNRQNPGFIRDAVHEGA